MVKLRLKRMGKKGAPFYRIVAADSRSPRDGRFIEQIGTYNPTKAEEKVTLDKELAKKRYGADRGNRCKCSETFSLSASRIYL